MKLTNKEQEQVLRIGMGTENVASLLEAIVKMTRPTQLLEIGAGYTTLAMLSAISEVAEERTNDSKIVHGEIDNAERQSLIIPRSATASYAPTLTVFEDFSVQPSSAHRVVDIAEQKGWSQYLNFVNEDFFRDGPNVLARLTSGIDLAWLDAGDPVEDIRFVNMILPYMSSDSWVIMHEPFLTIPVRLSDGTTEVRSVTVPVVSELIRSAFDHDGTTHLEFIVIPEVYKVRQGGALVVHKQHSKDQAGPIFDDMKSEVDALQDLLGTTHSGCDLYSLRF